MSQDRATSIGSVCVSNVLSCLASGFSQHCGSVWYKYGPAEVEWSLQVTWLGMLNRQGW